MGLESDFQPPPPYSPEDPNRGMGQVPMAQPVYAQPGMPIHNPTAAYQTQPAFAAPPQYGTNAVVYTNTASLFGNVSQLHRCQFCGYEGPTNLEHEIGLLTWLVTGALCFFLLFISCCCFGAVALCIPGLKDVYHHCGKCSRVVGIKRQI